MSTFAPLRQQQSQSNPVALARRVTPARRSKRPSITVSHVEDLRTSPPPIQRAPIQTHLEISQPGDELEREADRVAESVMRAPLDEAGPERRQEATVTGYSSGSAVQRACSGCVDTENDEEDRVQRSAEAAFAARDGGLHSDWSHRLHVAQSSSGEPLPQRVRRFMEPRFGADFGLVEVHHDETADALSRQIAARAFTVGRDVFFKQGEFAPDTERGQRLIAHELAHTLQQASADRVRRKAEPVAALERERSPRAATSPTTQRSTGSASAPAPETCAPPVAMTCTPAESSPAAVTNVLLFSVGSASLDAMQKAEVDATAAAWNDTGGSDAVRVDGYASPEGKCLDNWDLSCRRAQTVAAELATPSDGSPGIPIGKQEIFAHGESLDAGSALAPNRRATISVPLPKPKKKPCPMPVLLGSARGCGSGSDFTHFDFPSLSLTSELILAAWAQAHMPPRVTRWLVTDAECELEMDAVLLGLAGSDGHAAFSRFAAGTGGTVVHGAASSLGAMALSSGSFLATVASVRADIESQLAAQALSGALNPCALSVTPPATHFQSSDGMALKAVIGGTQGERLFATGFVGSVPLRTYSIDLRFVICDDFGVDESDLYAPGLFAFWVLQHERSASKYGPFINELDLPVSLSGVF